jgi:hypothetical protein
MPATLQKPAPNQKLERHLYNFVKCPSCEQRYVLIWDYHEWPAVKAWIHVATIAVRDSHPNHEPDQLPLPASV